MLADAKCHQSCKCLKQQDSGKKWGLHNSGFNQSHLRSRCGACNDMKGAANNILIATTAGKLVDVQLTCTVQACSFTLPLPLLQPLLLSTLHYQLILLQQECLHTRTNLVTCTQTQSNACATACASAYNVRPQ